LINGSCDYCELIINEDNATSDYPIVYTTNTANIRFIGPESLIIGKNKSLLANIDSSLVKSKDNRTLEILNKDFLGKNTTATVIIWNEIPENTTGSEENIDVISLYINNVKINDILMDIMANDS
jgi:hypothetical protein